MNHYIIDASIVIQRFIQQEYTPQVRIVFNRLLGYCAKAHYFFGLKPNN